MKVTKGKFITVENENGQKIEVTDGNEIMLAFYKDGVYSGSIKISSINGLYEMLTAIPEEIK